MISSKKVKSEGFGKKIKWGLTIYIGVVYRRKGVQTISTRYFYKMRLRTSNLYLKTLNFFHVVTSGSQCTLLLTCHFSSLLTHLQGASVSVFAFSTFLQSYNFTVAVPTLIPATLYLKLL